MYLWKTKMLAENIKNGDLKQKDFKNYLIAVTALTFIGLYTIILEPTRNSYVILFEMTGTILIAVFGINITFKTNGGNEGVEYLNRYISLSLPLYLKIIVAGFFLAAIMYILRELNMSDLQIEWLSSTSGLIVSIIFFWRLNVHIRYINA